VSAVAATSVLPQGGRHRRRIVASVRTWLLWAVLALFLLNVLAIVVSAIVDSFGTHWYDAWMPAGATTYWWTQISTYFDLVQVLVVTLEVAVIVVVVSLLIGVPSAYALARRRFPGHGVLMLLFLLPVMLPPISYVIPLATTLYDVHLGGTLAGVIIANLVPSVPFVVLVMTPFIEQLDPTLESAARMCGARTRHIFTRVIGPLLVPGMMAAAVLVLIRTVGMFELTYFTAGPTDQTLIVSLYYAISGAGIRPPQVVDAVAVIYMLTTLILLVIALRFVDPTQLVTRIKESPTK
jgi:putative spermidine/putrescine transport system permease protein